MPWWGLLIEVCFVWLLWGSAALANHAATAAHRGIPKGQREGVSLAPIIPVYPLVFWVAALLVDLAIGPWGTIVVSSFHAALGLCFVASIARDCWRIRSLDKRSNPDGSIPNM